MLKRLLLGTLSLGLAACASSPPAKAPAAAAHEQRGCVESASRVPGESTCTGFGRAYTQDDIKRTGAADPAEALRLLDPSLTIHGH